MYMETQEHYIKEKRTSLKTNDNIIVADPNSLNSGPTRKFCFFEQNNSHPKRGKRPSHNFKNIFEPFRTFDIVIDFFSEQQMVESGFGQLALILRIKWEIKFCQKSVI